MLGLSWLMLALWWASLGRYVGPSMLKDLEDVNRVQKRGNHVNNLFSFASRWPKTRVFAWFLKRGSQKNEENHENNFVLCDAVA